MAFVPPDDKRIIASWTDLDGTHHTAIFDSSTAQMIRESTATPAASVGGFVFVRTPEGPRFLADGPSYRFASVDSEERSPIPVPAGNVVLDLRGSMLVLEANASSIIVSVWDWTHPDRNPIPIESRDYRGGYFVLADGGDRVLEWTAGSNTLTVHDTSGQVVRRLNLDGPIRSYAIDPMGRNVVFAVGTELVFFDAANATVLSRAVNVVSGQQELSLFWVHDH